MLQKRFNVLQQKANSRFNGLLAHVARHPLTIYQPTTQPGCNQKTIDMNFNQFNPTPAEIETIKAENKNLPEEERTCYKCGHQHFIMGWCDWCLWNTNMQGNWEGVDMDDVKENGKVYPPHACCDMECSYL